MLVEYIVKIRRNEVQRTVGNATHS